MARQVDLSKSRTRGLAVALVAALAGLLLAGMAASGQDNQAFGTWYTKDRKSTVLLYPCGQALCGDIVALKEPNDSNGAPLLDTNNQIESLRDRPILGLQILRDFERVSDTRWEEGWGYDPKNGHAYDDVEIEMTGPDMLEIGGCFLWGAICQTQTWERVRP